MKLSKYGPATLPTRKRGRKREEERKRDGEATLQKRFEFLKFQEGERRGDGGLLKKAGFRGGPARSRGGLSGLSRRRFGDGKRGREQESRRGEQERSGHRGAERKGSRVARGSRVWRVGRVGRVGRVA